MAAKVSEIKQKLSLMESEQSTWRAHWQELIDYIVFFFQDIVTQRTPGSKKGSLLCDATGTVAAVDCAHGLYGTMTNPALPWFALKTENENLMDNREVKVWLDWMERQYYNLFNRSNFYTSIKEIYLALLVMGTGPIFIGDHFWNLAYFEPLNLGECYLAENQYGEIDTLYRCFQMYPRQMEQKWGYNKLSEKAQKAVTDKKITDKFTVLHAVEPRQDRDPERRDNRNFRWASVYLEKETDDTVMEEGGYQEFPYCVPRFFKASGETYGRGPGMMALPEIKELQKMKTDISQGTQLRLRPPLVLPHDGFLGPLNLTPFAINWFRSDGSPAQDRIGTIPLAGDVSYPDKELETKRSFIKQIFFNQLFEAMQDPRATLGQVMLANQKDMERLGPFLGQLQNELFNPMFDRLFSMMVRRFAPLWEAGRLPPPPPILAGENLRIDYISPLAKAQRQAEGQGIMQTLGLVEQVMKVKSDAMDNIDLDGTIRHAADLYGFPNKLLPSPEQIQAVRESRAKEMQMQQTAQMALEAAKVAPHLAKGPEPGSPLQALLGAGKQ